MELDSYSIFRAEKKKLSIIQEIHYSVEVVKQADPIVMPSVWCKRYKNAKILFETRAG
jgi:hypothetical protein